MSSPPPPHVVPNVYAFFSAEKDILRYVDNQTNLEEPYDAISSFPFFLDCYKLFVLR